MTTKRPTVLSLDWDYVTGDCIGDDHGHCGFCQTALDIRGKDELPGRLSQTFLG